ELRRAADREQQAEAGRGALRAPCGGRGGRRGRRLSGQGGAPPRRSREGVLLGWAPSPRARNGARPMKRTPLTAMLTLAAVLARSVALGACGGKSSSSTTTSSPETKTTSPSTTTTTKHGHQSQPSY